MRLLLLLIALIHSSGINAQKYHLFIGTYTNTGSKGIYVYRFDASTGKAEWVSNTEGIVNPSYLAIAPDKKIIYSCTETRTENAGGISAFAFERNKGTLTFINKQPSGGDNPAYVSVHKNGRWVAIGNYSGGSLSIYPVNKKGSLEPYVQNIQHSGRSIVEPNQTKPHVHATVFSPDYNFLYVPDLGIDKIVIYRFSKGAKQPLQTAVPAFAVSVPGSGPRHFTFHPNAKYAYLLEEISGTVMAYKYVKRTGRLDSIQRIATHAFDTKPPHGSADIHISPDGKFLYASNRGEQNNIAIFSIDRSTGKLTSVGYQSTLGKTPRNFIIDPSGKYLLAANQNSNTVVIFKRDIITGLLYPTRQEITVPQPVCLQMMR